MVGVDYFERGRGVNWLFHFFSKNETPSKWVGSNDSFQQGFNFFQSVHSVELDNGTNIGRNLFNYSKWIN